MQRSASQSLILISSVVFFSHCSIFYCFPLLLTRKILLSFYVHGCTLVPCLTYRRFFVSLIFAPISISIIHLTSMTVQRPCARAQRGPLAHCELMWLLTRGAACNGSKLFFICRLPLLALDVFPLPQAIIRLIMYHLEQQRSTPDLFSFMTS